MITTNASDENLFEIVVGDWSNDGHGKCETFTASANNNIEIVREAYFAAKEKYPLLCPENFSNEYEDRSISNDIRTALFNLGAPIEPVNELGDYTFGCEEMANLVCWFINLGNPDLDAKLSKTESLPTLHFYGFDNKNRHISFFGYGLF